MNKVFRSDEWNRDSDSMIFDSGAIKKLKIKIIMFSLFIVLIVMLILQGCFPESDSDIDIAVKRINDLFVVDDEEKIRKGEPGKIKESTDQEQIDEAVEAMGNVDTLGREHDDEEEVLVLNIANAIIIAQNQLKGREDEQNSSSAQDEQKGEEFHPTEDDIVSKNNHLINKDILEGFMKVAGENGEDNESEIRVVKDEGVKGVLIYHLKSSYDNNADQRWIEVRPDLSHYRASEDDTQDVFNNAPQQCGYMSKDELVGYYKLNECRTHWDYRFPPISNVYSE